MERTEQRKAFIRLLNAVKIEESTIIVVNLLLPTDEEIIPIVDLIEANHETLSTEELQEKILERALELTKVETAE